MPSQWIVISVDGLATSALGAYGSSWNETPAIDRLAAYGTVWDRCIIPSDDTPEVLRSLWSQPFGRSDLFLNAGPQASQIASLAGTVGFEQCTIIEAIPEPAADAVACCEVEETAFAKLLLPILERLCEPDSKNRQDWSLLWVHSDTLTRCWDAPRGLFPIDDDDDTEDEPIDRVEWSLEDFTQQTTGPILNSDVTDKPPALFESTAVPFVAIPADSHPDWVTSWMQTYGCQVRLLDRLIALLLEAVEAAEGEIGLALIGTSGFSLGQNGWIGHRAGAIRSPQIHVPAILYDGQGQGLRVPDLCSVATISNWLQPLMPSHQPARVTPAQWANADRDGQPQINTDSIRADRVLTTDQWFFVREADRTSLYLKPDDREDCNDVADRCRDVVEMMES